MRGNLLFNLVFGIIGFIFTLLFSLTNNLFMTSVIRGLISFAAWFLLAFLLRWAWASISTPAAGAALEGGEEAGETGTRFDVTTPDESDELNELLKQKPEQSSGSEDAFTPLNPPKLVTKKDPEELAQAVRHLTEK
ncbi:MULTISPECIES: hypothetical protein [Paenibacillus]|uniref:Uncharacterized protein n=1 Tax=Paenibacillus azoreducens TaxID=116718 RepID=A0A920CVC0_9BACL|nr:MULTISPECIES: hypothetical protein [Paenibacillus]MBE9913228.1 hypothetical protein [Paenibacillus donghaensis]GIO50352.1 hypothetical protein J34TS1_51170 [Paenibacillus azoreducens]